MGASIGGLLYIIRQFLGSNTSLEGVSRLQHIDSTNKLTAHVILYKFKSDLRAGNSGEEWGRLAKYAKRQVHF